MCIRDFQPTYVSPSSSWRVARATPVRRLSAWWVRGWVNSGTGGKQYTGYGPAGMRERERERVRGGEREREREERGGKTEKMEEKIQTFKNDEDTNKKAALINKYVCAAVHVGVNAYIELWVDPVSFLISADYWTCSHWFSRSCCCIYSTVFSSETLKWDNDHTWLLSRSDLLIVIIVTLLLYPLSLKIKINMKTSYVYWGNRPRVGQERLP